MLRLLISLCLAATLLSCSDVQEVKDGAAAAVDTDGDGWTDDYEEQIGTNPFGEDLDSDGDGVPDALERRLGTLEHVSDSDGDGTKDGDEDPDGDGLPTWFELKTGSDPGDDGSDDGLGDGWDDQDGDGLIDWLEFSFGTDPFKTDTDGDGIDDLDESQDPDLDGANEDSDGDRIKDGEDPFHTPTGCTDTDANVRHTYNTCINKTWHTRTVRYYTRQCLDNPPTVLHVIERDVDTGEPCDEAVTPPPPLSDLQ